MIVASLFGTPAGLEVNRIAIGAEASVVINDEWVDSLPDEVRLNGNEGICRVCRRIEGGNVLTWVALYRAASEIGAGRSGGFYGAGLWLIDTTVSSKLVYEVLVNLIDQINDLALSSNKFIKKISEIRNSVVPPPQVSMLLGARKQIASGLIATSNERAFLLGVNNIVDAIEWAQVGHSAEYYQEIIIGAADQIIEQKNVYKKSYQRFRTIVAAADFAYSNQVTQKESQLLATSKMLAEQKKLAHSSNTELQTLRLKLDDSADIIARLDAELDRCNKSLVDQKKLIKNLQPKLSDERLSTAKQRFSAQSPKNASSENSTTKVTPIQKYSPGSLLAAQQNHSKSTPSDTIYQDSSSSASFGRTVLIVLQVFIVELLLFLVLNLVVGKQAVGNGIVLMFGLENFLEKDKLNNENNKLKNERDDFSKRLEQSNKEKDGLEKLLQEQKKLPQDQLKQGGNLRDETVSSTFPVVKGDNACLKKENTFIEVDYEILPSTSGVRSSGWKEPYYIALFDQCFIKYKNGPCKNSIKNQEEIFIKDESPRGTTWLPAECFSPGLELNTKKNPKDRIRFN